jgi:hypothetical protein
MINGGYLIPANTKQGQLILGWFTPPDLILFGVGLALSILLLLIVGTGSTIGGIICLLPGLICAFLVMPIPNYRNVRTFFRSMYEFYFVRQRQYRWKGWCYNVQSKR